MPSKVKSKPRRSRKVKSKPRRSRKSLKGGMEKEKEEEYEFLYYNPFRKEEIDWKYLAPKLNLSKNMKFNEKTNKYFPPPKDLYNCPFCDYTTRRKDTLKFHVNTHNIGYKAYLCDMCDKGFTQRGELVKHKMKNHGVDIRYRKNKSKNKSKKM
jgi:uncharacterized C2H2 Zn-finger protein